MKHYNFHYVYRITNIKEKMYYYGVHSCNCLPKEDIGIKYYSSSSLDWFIQDQKINKQDYKYKIVKLFPTRDEANKYELLLLYKFKVTKNEKFYNKAIYCNNSLHSDGRIQLRQVLSICKITGKSVLVSQEEFDSNPDLVGVNYGKVSGARNARAKTFILEHNNIKYTVVGEINKFCEEHNISLNALKSHRGEYITLAMIGSNHRYEKVKNTIGWKLYEV